MAQGMPATHVFLNRWLQLAVSLLCLALVGIHVLTRYKLDTIAVALLVLAALPWALPLLAPNLRSLELPFAKIEFLERQVKAQEGQIQKQQTIINELVLYSMSHYIFTHLSRLYHTEKGEYLFRKNEAFEHDIRFLRDHGYLALNFDVAQLRDEENLVGKLQLTPAGQFFVQLREQYDSEGQGRSLP